MGLFTQYQLGLAAFEGDGSFSHRQQSGNHSQKRGFAGAIGASDGKRLARGDLEIEPREHLTPAPHTADATPREPHFVLSKPSGIYRYRSRNIGWRNAKARLSVWRCHWNDSISRNLMQHTIRVCKPS